MRAHEPTHTQHGDKLRLRGRGIFSAERGLKGDQYVEVRVSAKGRAKECALACVQQGALAASTTSPRHAPRPPRAQVVLPRSLTPRQRELLEEFSAEEGRKLSSKSWWKG